MPNHPEPTVHDAIDRIVEASRRLLHTDESPVRREQHPKHHGCVRARFVIPPGLEARFQTDLFRPSTIYDAWIRFSNGGQRDDRKPDAHGMAIKLLGVRGAKILDEERDAQTHDFVMVDSPIFFLRTAREYGEFSGALLEVKGKAPSRLYNALGFLGGKPRELVMLFLLFFSRRPPRAFFKLLRFVSRRITNPLTTRYWSTTPYRFGGHIVKFSAMPGELSVTSPVDGPADSSNRALLDYLSTARAAAPVKSPMAGVSADYLRETMARSLNSAGSVFLFRIQLFKGSDLRLMSWGNGSGVPTSGHDLVIAGTDSDGLLHIRTFDGAGVRTDTFESKDNGGVFRLKSADPSGKVLSDVLVSSLPTTQAGAITTLKQRLPGLLPPHLLSSVERGRVLSEVTSITGRTLKDERATPIDDPTVEWRESESEFHTVAWIWIPPQIPDTRGRMDFCEELSFTPWHALPDHEPLGEINAVRRAVYRELSEARHDANQVELREPQRDPNPDNPAMAPRSRNAPATFSQVLGEELDWIKERRKRLESSNVQPQHRTGAAHPGDSSDETSRDTAADGAGSDEPEVRAAEGDPDASGPQPDEQKKEGTPPTVTGGAPVEDEGTGGAARVATPAPPTDEDGRVKQARKWALEGHVTGLSFSGGGIRAGTFAVGFLQGLAGLGLLRHFDYLSTVSGGGYAGAWLAAWLKREGDLENVARQLGSNRVEQSRANRRYLTVERGGQLEGEVVDPEPQPLQHLRAYSSYLFPRPGILSTDTWTVILIWLRNVTINLLMLLPATMMAVVGARSLVYLYNRLNQVSLEDDRSYFLAALAMLGFGYFCLWRAISVNESALREFRGRDPRTADLRFRIPSDPQGRDLDLIAKRRIIMPATIAALLLTASLRWFLWRSGDVLESATTTDGRGSVSMLQSIGRFLGRFLGQSTGWSAAAHALAGGVIGGIWAWRRLRGYALQLMSWGDGSKVSTSGQNLVIAGTDSNGLLHIRTFDGAGVRTDTYEAMEGGTLHLVSADASGNVLSDAPESSLSAAQTRAIAGLKQRLPGLLPSHDLTQAEDIQVLGEATLITGQTRLRWGPDGPRGAAVEVGAGVLAGGILGLLVLILELLVRYVVWDYMRTHTGLFELPSFLLNIVVFAVPATIGAWYFARRAGRMPRGVARAALLGGATGGVLMVLVEWLVKRFALWERPDLMAEFAAPSAILSAVLAFIVEVALLGRAVSEGEREWWARISAMLTRRALFWLALGGIILYVPGLFLSSGPIIRTLIASGWIGSAVVGVLTGRFALPKTGGDPAIRITQAASVASIVFLAGLLGAVALVGSVLLNTPALYAPHGDDLSPFGYYIKGVNGTTFVPLLVVFLGSLALFQIARRLIDVNLFSLNAMYASRLTRCYLGASRAMPTWEERWGSPRDPRANAGAPSLSLRDGEMMTPARDANPVTGFDLRDDFDLSDLRIGERNATGREYLGPHLLINATLNLVGGDELAWRDRKGESFTLSPLYCGSRTVGYSKLNDTDLLIIPINDTSDMPREERNLIILGARATPGRGSERLHFRIFDCDGKMVVDRDEASLSEKATQIDALKRRLASLPSRDLTSYEKDWLRPLVASIVDRARPAETDPDESMDPNLTLGRAIAISGAAVDPNMNFYQSASLTALLTLFNARLGYWIEKPRPSCWTAKSPRFGDLLFSEFLGLTDTRGEFVHISDGGHFENLGVYELVRRRCRYIVALDAGEDWDASDDNLANLIRLCRIDFGVRIQIDTSPLKPEGPDRLTRSHVAIGQVRYDDVDQGEMPGVLVYVKISMTGDEPPDLQKYARKDERFPHHPTDLRQSFDEEVFECYRCLGEHIAWDVFGDAVRNVKDEVGGTTNVLHTEFVPRLFYKIQNLWAEPPQGQSEQFLGLTRAWADLQKDLGSRPELARLSRDLYPELPAAPRGDTGGWVAGAGSPSDVVRAELHAVGRMLQMMEDTWISLGLRRYSALPMNRGWLNSFRRWGATEAFRRHWPALRPEFSSDFVEFCEGQLNLTRAKTSLMPLAGPVAGLAPFEKKALESLSLEFRREWPKEVCDGRGLDHLFARGCGYLIIQAPSGTQLADQAPEDEKIVSGVILLTLLKDKRANDPGAVELFVWIRPPHRTAGLASECLTRQIVNGLQRAVGNKPLWVRYPIPEANDNDIEYVNWLSFFTRYDFKQVLDSSRPRWPSILLKRDPL
jgi:uncharacterized protein YodC (DUF2158 family)